MIEVPEEYLFGLDVAVKKLCPNARFTIAGTSFLDWQDPDNERPPSWESIVDQMQQDEKKYLEYISNVQNNTD